MKRKTFSIEFRLALGSRGIRTADAAAHLGVTIATIHNWKVGLTLPRVERIPQIAELLGVEPRTVAQWLES